MEYLGTIDVANGSSKNNTNCTTPFTIPLKFTYILAVTPSGSTVTYFIRVGNDDALAATTDDFSIGELTSIQIAAQQNATALPVIAIRGGGGTGNVKIYGLYGRAQS